MPLLHITQWVCRMGMMPVQQPNTNTHMPNANETNVVSAPIEASDDLVTPKLSLREGMRYVRRDGVVTGVMIEVPTVSGVVIFRDMLDNSIYMEDGRVEGFSEEFQGNLERELPPEEYPMEVMVGGVYRRRDGELTGYIASRKSSEYPLLDKRNQATYTADGRFTYERSDSDYDLVEAVYLPLLREGWCGRRRDGRLTGCIRAVPDPSIDSPYLLYDPESSESYTPCGRYQTGLEHPRDIVELVGKWEDIPAPEGAIVEGLPLRVGDLVEAKHVDGTLIERFVERTHDGRLTVGGHLVDEETGIISSSEGRCPRCVTRLISRAENFDMDLDDLRILVKMEWCGRFKWLSLGNNVRCGYFAPWAYRNADSFGAIKDNGQRMDGYGGTYIVGLPVSCDLDPESIEGRRHSASVNALVKYWHHRVSVHNEHEVFSGAGIPISGVASRVEEFFHGEFPRVENVASVNDVIVHMTYESADTAMVLSKEGGYYKCKPITWAKLFTALNKEKGTATDDEMRRLFMQRFDKAVSSSDVEVQWSTVGDTYCTPMEGWSDEDDSVTGSCMEKFCNDDGNGHAVFDVYKALERKNKLKMIKIFISYEYVGRAICWWPDGTSGWVMDRVYCRLRRGEIPPTVISSLAKFASENQIIARTKKCKVESLPHVCPADISAGDLTGYDYYPYFDTYAGISYDGVHMDSSECSVVCDCPDGEPNQREMYEAYNRDGRYHEAELRWSTRYDAYVHEDDAVDTYNDEVIHEDESVELGFDSGRYAHEDDVIEVKLPNSNGRMTTVWAIEN